MPPESRFTLRSILGRGVRVAVEDLISYSLLLLLNVALIAKHRANGGPTFG